MVSCTSCFPCTTSEAAVLPAVTVFWTVFGWSLTNTWACTEYARGENASEMTASAKRTRLRAPLMSEKAVFTRQLYTKLCEEISTLAFFEGYALPEKELIERAERRDEAVRALFIERERRHHEDRVL